MPDHDGSVPEQRRRDFDRRALWLGVLGTPFLVHAIWSLRWAHRYRQSTGEGLAIIGVFVELLLASLLVGSAAAMLAVAASWSTDREARRRRQWGSKSLAAVLTIAWAGSLWVAGHGDRCIGPCGAGWFGS